MVVIVWRPSIGVTVLIHDRVFHAWGQDLERLQKFNDRILFVLARFLKCLAAAQCLDRVNQFSLAQGGEFVCERGESGQKLKPVLAAAGESMTGPPRNRSGVPVNRRIGADCQRAISTVVPDVLLD